MNISRRAVVLGLAALFGSAAEALAARRKKASRPARSAGRKGRSEPKAAAAPTPPAQPKKPEGRPLAIPELVELKEGEPFVLTAGRTPHAFLDDKPVDLSGYNGRHLGPALKLERGTRPQVRLVNGLDRPTNLHWHGLLVDGRNDGGMHGGIAPGEAWEAVLDVDQPAATCWYHAHVHGRVAEDIQDGLAGFLIVDEPAARGLDLPSTWGVDDIPLLIQDRNLDEDGHPVYERSAAVIDHGFRGQRITVNGTLDAVATVPQRMVRLRLLNASNARTYRIYFSDERSFQLIATDGGFLPKPVEADTLSLAPGERVEILVDFGDGGTNLMSTPDDHEHRQGGEVMRLADVVAQPFRIVAFTTTRDEKSSHKLPAALAAAPLPQAAEGLKHRRFVLQLGPAQPKTTAAGAMPAGHDHHAMLQAQAGFALPTMRINGKSFDPTRVDEQVPLGAVEIWEIVSPEMAHPFHIHGAQFTVLSEDGGTPKIWNRGVKDTVFVENSAELLVRFTRPASAEAPFVYHCHVLEHEDAGMMGTYTVA